MYLNTRREEESRARSAGKEGGRAEGPRSPAAASPGPGSASAATAPAVGVGRRSPGRPSSGRSHVLPRAAFPFLLLLLTESPFKAFQ